MIELGSEWHVEPITPELLQVEKIKEVIYSGKTAYQSVQILDTACFGITLVLDGKTQSTELDEFVYHEGLVQPSLISHPNPEKVFIAGGGEGATLREVLSHKDIRQAVMVDIDREVVDLCRRYLPKHHQGAFDDPRLELHHTDALRFLEESQERYDVIIIDVPDPIERGPAYLLFTQEFYRLAKDRLNDQGLIVAQAGATGPSFFEQSFASVAYTMSTLFPAIYPYEAFIPSFGCTWGFVMGSLGPNPLALDIQKVDSLLAQRVTSTLRYYDGTTHRGMFSIPKYLRDAIAKETRLITKENPVFLP